MALGGWLSVCGLLLLGCAWALSRPGLVGAPMEATMDKEAQQALRFAMDRYNRASNDAYLSRVSEVVSVRKQVVAGIKYYFEVKIGRTSCRNSKTVVENCEFMVESDQEKAKTCNLVVFAVPWRESVSLVKNECQ